MVDKLTNKKEEENMIAEVDYNNKIISASSKYIRTDLEYCIISSFALGMLVFMIPLQLANLFKHWENITRTVFSSFEYLGVLILIGVAIYHLSKGLKRTVGKYK